jgi:membrane protease YdiL (CAAX protease family)
MISMCRKYFWPTFPQSCSSTHVYLLLHLLFLLLGVVLPIVLFVGSHRRRKAGKSIGHWSQKMKLRLYFGNGGLLWIIALTVIAAWYFADGDLTRIGLGWGESPYDLTAVLVLSAFLLLYLLDLYQEAGSSERREETRREFRKMGFMPTTATQFMNFIFLAVAAGVCEEVIYRGFMITYLRDLLGDSPLAIAAVLLIPAIAFGLGHFYQGGKAVVKIIAMAVLFGFFYLQTDTLWPLMLLHAAIDVVGGLMSWWLNSKEEVGRY